MDDFTNRQPTFSEPPTTGASSPVEDTSTRNPGQPLDEASWLATIRNLYPWSPFLRVAPRTAQPLLWGLGHLTGIDRKRLGRLQQAIAAPRWKKELTPLLKTWLLGLQSSETISLEQAIEGLAWAYLLPLLVQGDQSELPAILLAELVRLADPSCPGDDAESLLQRLWLQVELPLVLAHFSADPQRASSYRSTALETEANLATAVFDPLSYPRHSRGKLLRPWLASLLRAQELLRGAGIEFPTTTQERMRRLGQNVLRLSRPNGSSVLHLQAGTENDREFLQGVGNAMPELLPLVKLGLGKLSREAKLPKGLPAAPHYSPDSSLTILRTRWTAPAVQVTVDFSGPQVWLDLCCGNQSLLHGDWTSQIRVNDETLSPTSSWTEVCTHSDGDCDYLEIEQKLSGGWLLQRHLLLVRRDETLLVADSLLTERKLPPQEFLATAASAPRLDYSSSLPLTTGVTFTPQERTREGYLTAAKKQLGLVLPLAMPEWRKQPFPGELATTESSLTHSIRATARNLFAPLWLDLNPNRFRKAEATWRQLTIGEFLAIQPREVAVGYRVQVRNSQWLLYRSLAWRGNRTVLGKNFATDFACCRFHPNGETDEILEVQ
jgi:hypothetical protein